MAGSVGPWTSASEAGGGEGQGVGARSVQAAGGGVQGAGSRAPLWGTDWLALDLLVLLEASEAPPGAQPPAWHLGATE